MPPREIELLREKLRDTGDLVRGVVLPTDDLSPRVLPLPPLPKIACIMRVVIDSLRNVSMASEEPPAVMVVCFVWNATERRSRNARQV